MRVECAQCHNHPFADWKKDQFWGLAAFFAGLQTQRAGDVLIPLAEIPGKRELKIPGTETVVQARFLDGVKPDWNANTQTRKVLADWVTSKSNPYFARAAANRTWAYFLGAGLVEPIDDMVGTCTISTHPELLDLLAREFAEHDFDLKFLIRAITLSEAYQPHEPPASTRARAILRRLPACLCGLTPEQP